MQTHLFGFLILTTVLVFSKSSFGHELSTPPTPPPSPSLLAHSKLAFADPLTPPPSPSPLAPPCITVVAELSPCLPFLRGEGSTPSESCCTGVVDMSNKAKSKGDRQAICGCVKEALANVKYQPQLISVLPENCGASMTLPPIDSKTDCSKYYFSCSRSEGLLRVKNTQKFAWVYLYCKTFACGQSS